MVVFPLLLSFLTSLFCDCEGVKLQAWIRALCSTDRVTIMNDPCRGMGLLVFFPSFVSKILGN